ncbi:MAG: hypothetical protein MAG795_00906 [Candidatus Woesearchaeota archaeon]|nr:hypothetical protein [Candidatus Woesearchaeota archaeon]
MKKAINDILLQVSYNAVSVFSWSFVFLFFLSKKVTYTQMLIFYLIVCVVASIVSVLMRKFTTSKMLALSLIFRIGTYAAIINLVSIKQVYLSGIAFGAFIPLFWISYKINLFRHSKKENTATLCGVMTIIYPTLRLFLPVAGAFIIKSFGYNVLFQISIAALIAVIIFALRSRPKKVKLDFRESLKKTKKINLLIFMEGMSRTLAWIIVPLLTLQFVQEAVSFGLFITVTNIFGVIAAIWMTKHSDKKQQRVEYIYPAAVASGLFYFAAAFANSIVIWTILIGLATFASRILIPFYEAVVLDKRKNLHNSVHSREMLINFGRVAAILFILIFYLLFNSLRVSLAILALAGLYYPYYLSKNKIYEDSQSIHTYMKNKATNLASNAILKTYFFLPNTNDKLKWSWKYIKDKIK